MADFNSRYKGVFYIVNGKTGASSGMHPLFFLFGILLEFRMFFCIIEEESTQDNTQVVEDGKTCMNRRLQLQIV